MDYLRFLSQYPVLRRVIRDSSERTGPWRRFFFCGPLVNFVHKLKTDCSQDFNDCLDPQGAFLARLYTGELDAYNHLVVNHLHLETPGRVATSLAFVTWLLDKWDNNNLYSPDFVLDALCIPLWKLIKERIQKENMEAAASAFQQELEEEGLMETETLVPQSPEQPQQVRVDTEEGDLHLAEVVEVVGESSCGEEDEDQEKVIAVASSSESEGESEGELEIVFAEANGFSQEMNRNRSLSSSSNSSVEMFSPLSGVAPLASSDSCCSDTDEGDQDARLRGASLPSGQDPGLDQEID